MLLLWAGSSSAQVNDLTIASNPSFISANSDSFLSWNHPTASGCLVQLNGYNVFGGTVGNNVRTDGASGTVVGPWGHLINDAQYTLFCWFPGDSRWHYGQTKVLVEPAANPGLTQLFAGNAHFNTAAPESVSLTFTTPQPSWDQKKLSILKNHSDNKFYAFTRKFVTTDAGVPDAGPGASWTIAVLRSGDEGRSFSEVQSGAGANGELFSLAPHLQLYDPHISIDATQSPPLYVMVMECNTDGEEFLADAGLEWASACVSTSTDPFNPLSWTAPRVLIDGCDTNAQAGCTSSVHHSASTPVTLMNGSEKLVSWTAVEDNSPYSRARSEGYYFWPMWRLGANWSYVLMDATPQPFCTSWWDCNNRDKQDWKYEAGRYFLVYNGANYYRCDQGRWGITIAQSTTGPFGQYGQLPFPIFQSATPVGCNYSYPTLPAIEGAYYLYYSVSDATSQGLGTARNWRVKLIAN